MRIDEAMGQLIWLLSTLASAVMMLATPDMFPGISRAAVVGSVQADTVHVVIYTDMQMLGACVLGSLAGAALSILLFPGGSPDKTAPYLRREDAVKFLCSMVGGVGFAPMIMRIGGIPHDLTYLIPISIGVAFFFVTSVHKLMPLMERTIGTWLESVFTKFFGK